MTRQTSTPSWTRARIVAELLRIRLEEGWPTLERVRRIGGEGFVRSIRRLFGGLPEARAAAGLRRAASERDDVLRWLRQRIRDDEAMRFADLPRALQDAVQAHFTSYELARSEAAGRERFATAQDAADEVRRVAAQGLPITAPDLIAGAHHELVRAIGRFFGDLASARRAAGIADSIPREPLPVQGALDALRRRALELGRTPRAGELQPAVRAQLLERFGSYADALRRAGLEPLVVPTGRPEPVTSKIAVDEATPAPRARRGSRLPADGAREAPKGSNAGGIEEP